MQNIACLTLSWVMPIAFIRPRLSGKVFLSLFGIRSPNVIHFLVLMKLLFFCSHFIIFVRVCKHRIILHVLKPILHRIIVRLTAPQKILNLNLIKILLGSFLDQLGSSDLILNTSSNPQLCLLPFFAHFNMKIYKWNKKYKIWSKNNYTFFFPNTTKRIQ